MIELNGVRDALAAITPHAPSFFRAPGSVTLIGDHVDYTQGFALAIAADREAVVAAAPRADATVRVVSLQHNETASFDLTSDAGAEPWLADVQRAARTLKARGVALRGIDLALHATMRSPAAIEQAAALALLAASGTTMEPRDLALALGRERGGVGGALASALGSRDHALLIDCRSEEATTIPFELDGAALVWCDPHLPVRDHDELLLDRRAVCAEAATILRTTLPKVKTLRDVSLNDFMRVGDRLPPMLRRRARHIVTENVRTLQAVAALRALDPIEIGARMNESHDSLRDDYEVGTEEAGFIATSARTLPGVFGARMTGAGFGDTVVALVRRDALPAIRATLASSFRNAFGREPAIVEVRAACGAAPILA
jgi:galactokinase